VSKLKTHNGMLLEGDHQSFDFFPCSYFLVFLIKNVDGHGVIKHWMSLSELLIGGMGNGLSLR